MAAPYFGLDHAESGGAVDGGGGGNEGSVSGEELYHLLMLAYPAYTVARIEAELTVDQIEDLMAQWRKHPPAHIEARRTRMILGRAHGVTFRDGGGAAGGGADDASLMQNLSEMLGA